MWGFYDKEAILRRSIDNLNLSIIDKGNRNVVFKEYSNLKWARGLLRGLFQSNGT
jgi:hypothetical protein